MIDLTTAIVCSMITLIGGLGMGFMVGIVVETFIQEYDDE